MVSDLLAFGGMILAPYYVSLIGFGAYAFGLSKGQTKAKIGVYWIIPILAFSQLFTWLLAPCDSAFGPIFFAIMGGLGIGAFFAGLARGRKANHAAEGKRGEE